MSNLSATAERLRAVKSAQERFLAMYAVECIFTQSGPYDRLARDLAAMDGRGGFAHHEDPFGRRTAAEE
jgi:hypothetical protein